MSVARIISPIGVFESKIGLSSFEQPGEQYRSELKKAYKTIFFISGF